MLDPHPRSRYVHVVTLILSSLDTLGLLLTETHHAESYYGFFENILTFEFWRLDDAAKAFFAFQLIYGPAIGLTKMSITFMYFRILQDHTIQVVLWMTQVLNVLVIISAVVGVFFACTPLEYYWTYSIAIPGGTCLDIWMFDGYYTALNLFLDLLLILLPSQYIWNNIIETKARIGIMLVFCVGLMRVSAPSPTMTPLADHRT